MCLPADRANKYVAKLTQSLADMHERVKSKDQHDRRVRALREAGSGHAIHFGRGDYVMVSATGNQANVKRHNKSMVMVKWQGPYECMGLVNGDPDNVLVSLVGQDDTSKVSWRQVRRIAGPNMTVTQTVQDSALHDLQKFKVEAFVDWGFADDGNVVMKVRWRGFDEDEYTWDPLTQLDEDVEVLVGQYVERIDNADLTKALVQARGRRRSRTATTRRQTDRLAVRTYADAATNVTANADRNVTANADRNVTTNADRHADRNTGVRQTLTSDE